MIECKNLTNGLRIATAGTYFTCCHTFNNPYKDENGKDGLVLDIKSMHPGIKKPFSEKLIKDLKLGIQLFKIED